MIERGKIARDVIRLVVRRGARRAEPQVARHRGHRAQDRYWIEPCRILIAEPDPDLEVQAVAVRDAEPVGEEDEVELSALERRGDAQVEVEVEKVDVVRRIPPNRVAVAHRPGDEEAAQVYLSHAFGSPTSTRGLRGDACEYQSGGCKAI